MNRDMCKFESSQKEICASLNHRKKTKADGSRLIPRKHTETLVLLSVALRLSQFSFQREVVARSNSMRRL